MVVRLLHGRGLTREGRAFVMSAPAVLWGQEWADADDSALLALARGGDAEAYAELWRRHLPAAYSVAHRHLSLIHISEPTRPY